MSDDRWRRIEEVFHHAAELGQGDRATFLANACGGDDEFRREVESLLAHDDTKDNLVGTAVARAVDQLPGEQDDWGKNLAGKHIGPYLVTELIGKGGMGMVFKARDTKLNRLVAIKALRPDPLADVERRRRFIQEAKATSALNHPNIVTIHSITQESGTDFIIMEYVSGKTLEQLIPRKGLPLKQALKYALEIADALAAAHTAGILHRDVKPSNIMVTEQGRVKVLDFGLAKLAEPTSATEPTLTEAPDTKAGRVFGTAAYMSPEQAQGKQADVRSDIFAFGALLYQMVTGRRAFPGENVITILAAVIHQEPPPVRNLVAETPRELEWIITRCLKKGPEHRIQHMVDVKIALEEAQERIESPSAVPVVRPRRIWLRPVLVALLLGLVPGAWLGQWIFRKPPITFQRLTFRRGDVVTARFAPNGAVIYSAEWDGAAPTLFLVQPGSREARDLSLPSGAVQSVSLSGEIAMLIGASNERTYGTLARVPLAGGLPRSILESVWSADWGPEGNSLAVVRTLNGRFRVEYPIGTVLYETEALRPPVYLRVAPKGDRVSFFDFTNAGDYSLNVVDAARKRQILSRGWRVIGGAAWSPDSQEIWFGGGRTGTDPALYAVDLRGRERMLTQNAGGLDLHDVARDGRVLVANVDSRVGIRSLAPGVKEERDLAWLDASSVWDISNDGKEILIVELSSGEGRNAAIYLRRTDGSPAVRLGYGNRPSLSPDGKWVACVRRDGDNSRLVLLPTGPGEERTLVTSGIQPESAEWFPDGKRILFTGNEVNQPPRTFVFDPEGGAVRAVTSPGTRASAISPDSQFAVVTKSGKLYLHSLGNGQETLAARVTPEDSVIRWSGDGRGIFLRRIDAKGRDATVLRLDVSTGHVDVWRELKTPDPTAYFFGWARLSSDGKAYAFSFQRDLGTLYLVQGVK